MARLRPYPVFALAAWSLFVWTSRLGLAWETEPTLGRKLLATVPVAIFVAIGAAVVALLLRRDVEASALPLSGAARMAALGAAAWTITYWVVRMPMIAVGPHEVAFKAVHAVLAAVSIGLSVWVLTALRSARERVSVSHG